MHFSLVDRVLERTDSRIVTLKQVSRAEEYLQDHFATFPVLPGVFMLESMVQAARLLAPVPGAASPPLVLSKVKALKYGAFVRPGYALRVEIDLSSSADGEHEFKGTIRLLDPAAPAAECPTACSGRFVLRPARVGVPAPVSDPVRVG